MGQFRVACPEQWLSLVASLVSVLRGEGQCADIRERVTRHHENGEMYWKTNVCTSEFIHFGHSLVLSPPNNSSNYVSHPLWSPFLCSCSLTQWLMMKHGTQGRIQAHWLLFSPLHWQDVDFNHMARQSTYTHSRGLSLSACCKKLALFTLV